MNSWLQARKEWQAKEEQERQSRREQEKHERQARRQRRFVAAAVAAVSSTGGIGISAGVIALGGILGIGAVVAASGIGVSAVMGLCTIPKGQSKDVAIEILDKIKILQDSNSAIDIKLTESEFSRLNAHARSVQLLNEAGVRVRTDGRVIVPVVGVANDSLQTKYKELQTSAHASKRINRLVKYGFDKRNVIECVGAGFGSGNNNTISNSNSNSNGNSNSNQLSKSNLIVPVSAASDLLRYAIPSDHISAKVSGQGAIEVQLGNDMAKKSFYVRLTSTNKCYAAYTLVLLVTATRAAIIICGDSTMCRMAAVTADSKHVLQRGTGYRYWFSFNGNLADGSAHLRYGLGELRPETHAIELILSPLHKFKKDWKALHIDGLIEFVKRIDKVTVGYVNPGSWVDNVYFQHGFFDYHTAHAALHNTDDNCHCGDLGSRVVSELSNMRVVDEQKADYSNLQTLTYCKVHKLPVVGSNTPTVVLADLSMDELARMTATVASDLPLECEQLYNIISGPRFRLNTRRFRDFSEVIKKSIHNPRGWCYQTLKKKGGEFSGGNQDDEKLDPMTYLRITLGVNGGRSPGVPYVLEIWPAGHGSPIHNHGNTNAIIRVLHGSVDVRLFPYLSKNPDLNVPFTEITPLEAGDITYLTPGLNQVHQLWNNGTEPCVTIQCYRYPAGDNMHYEYFDYLESGGDDEIHQFTPESDMDFLEFRDKMEEEKITFQDGS